MKEELNKTNQELKLEEKPKEYDYSVFLERGFELDSELMEKFNPIAQKLNLEQNEVELLIELALEMSDKQKNIYINQNNKTLENTIEEYSEMFNQDRDIPNINSQKIKEYMEIANDAYTKIVSPKLKELFKKTGLNYHPELIKMFYRLGEFTKEDCVSYSGKPAQKELTPAQILYGKKD